MITPKELTALKLNYDVTFQTKILFFLLKELLNKRCYEITHKEQKTLNFLTFVSLFLCVNNCNRRQRILTVDVGR